MVQVGAYLVPSKSLLVHTTTAKQATYFPNWYFRRMVVNYMVNHRQLIFENKYLALMSLYGVKEWVDQGRDWSPPVLQAVPSSVAAP